MKRLFKFLFTLLGALVLLIVIAAIVIPLVVDPNDYKDQITALVEKRTGRTFSIPGKIELWVFPWLGVEIGEVALGNAPGFGEQPFVKANKVEVRVQLLPLLKKHVEMDTIVIKGMTLNLARDKNGKTNWQDLLMVAEEPGPTPIQAPEEKAPPITSLALSGLDVQDATINWNDQQTNAHYIIKGLNLETGALLPGEPIELELEFDVESKQPAVEGQVAVRGTLEFDLDTQQYQMTPVKLKITLRGDVIPAGELELEASSNIDVNLDKQTVSLSELSMKVLGLKANGELQAREILSEAPRVIGKLNVATSDSAKLLKGLGQDDLVDLVKQASLETAFSGTVKTLAITPLNVRVTLAGKNLPEGEAEVALTTGANLDLDQETLRVGELTLQGLGLIVNAQVEVQKVLSDPSIKGTLQVPEFNPRQLLEQLGEPLETTDPKALTRGTLQTTFSGSSNQFKLDDIKAQLDDTTLTGNLAVKDFTQPVIRFLLAADTIDADRYLPPAKSDGSTKSATGTKPGEGGAKPGEGAALPLPLDALRALDLAGDVTIGKLKAANITLTKLKLSIKAADGLVTLSPATAELYEGQFNGSIRVDAREAEPKFDVDQTLTGIQVGPLLKDLTGSDRLLGKGDFKAKLAASGTQPKEIKKSLSGQASFSFQNGAVKGVNIAQLIRDTKARLTGKPLSADAESLQTDFSELKATLSFDKGVVSNHDLSAKSPLLRVEGKGNANLLSEQIDYLINTTIVKTTKGQGGKELADLAGVTIPIRVSGTFDSPKYSPDIEGLLKAKAKAELNKQLDKQKEKATEKIEKKLGNELGKEIGDELKDKLKDLFR